MFTPSELTLVALVLLFSAFAKIQISPDHARPAAPKSSSQSAPKVVSIGEERYSVAARFD
jgi:hypothetical protein